VKPFKVFFEKYEANRPVLYFKEIEAENRDDAIKKALTILSDMGRTHGYTFAGVEEPCDNCGKWIKLKDRIVPGELYKYETNYVFCSTKCRRERLLKRKHVAV
jgi:hypothetical protein